MTHFEVRQCTNLACHLRLPIDVNIHRGAFCPLCGAPMEKGAAYEEYSTPIESEVKSRKIVVLLDNIRSAYNVGSIFRTADGVGIEKIYLCGITPIPNKNPSIAKTALGVVDQVSWCYHPNAYVLARDFYERGYRLIALERSSRSVPFHKFDFSSEDDRTMVLILGNERAGVDPGLIDLCERVLSLPMLGNKESLNVAVVFGVAAYWLSLG